MFASLRDRPERGFQDASQFFRHRTVECNVCEECSKAVAESDDRLLVAAAVRFHEPLFEGGGIGEIVKITIVGSDPLGNFCSDAVADSGQSSDRLLRHANQIYTMPRSL